jgi:hypothetical protein
MRRSITLAAVLLATAIAPLPAMAAQAEPATPDPVVAASLSAGVPALLTLGAVTITQLPVPIFGFVMPLGYGAGHMYAGDPLRGLLVGAGGYGAALGGGLVGFGVEKLVAGSGSPLNGTTGMVVGAGLALFAYGGWSASDAYHTAAKQREAARAR